MNLDSVNTSYFENDILILSDNKLTLKHQGVDVILSKNQTRLLACLVNGINDKESIIEYIWGSINNKSRKNSYNQLIFKTKLLLVAKGFPDDFIITIARYGLCINKNFLAAESALKHYPKSIVKDPAFLY